MTFSRPRWVTAAVALALATPLAAAAWHGAPVWLAGVVPPLVLWWGARRPPVVPAAPPAAAPMGDAIDEVAGELRAGVATVGEQSERTVARMEEAADAVGAISNLAGSMRAAANATEATVGEVDAARGELEQVITRVAAGAEHTGVVARDAVGAADEVAAAMRETTGAAEEVGSIADVIADIADRTNLLALNATIEAARAGESGRGFAVVAGEVKQLAQQTADATRRIGAQIEAIRTAVTHTAEGIEHVRGAIGRMDEAAAGAGEAVGVQRDVAERIGAATAAAVAHTGALARDVGEVAGKADATAELARFVSDQARETARVVDRLGEDTVAGLRRSEKGDRRRHPRTPCELRARLELDGHTLEGRTRDLSLGGALVALDRGTAPQGGTGRLELEGIGTLAVELRDVSTLGLHLQFRAPPAEAEAAIGALLARVAAEDADFTARVEAGARSVEARFEAALADGRIDLDGLFDTDYRAVPGTDPRQFTTRFTELCDAVLPDVQEPIKAGSPRIVFCAAMDRNAYLPTHNHAFAHAQRPDDPVWNAAHCRQRRKFDDRAGLAAARNTKPALLQSYPRDMGGGRVVMLKEADAPITVRGRHWGCLRLAYTLR